MLKTTTTTTILTREQELDLLVKAQNGDKAAKDFLVEVNLPLVKSVVRKYKENGLPWEDLVNEGVIGLLKAIEDFDTTSGNKLSTFATYKIKQVAVRALENNGRTVRIPVYKLALMNKVKRMEGALAQKLGRAATIEEVAKALEITATEVRECKKLLVPTQSLDVQVGEEEGTSMLDMIEDSENFVMTVEEKAIAEAVDRAIASIKASDRDKQIIKMRFGIGTQKDGMTLEDIGKVYGITRERVRQIESTILGKLALVEELKGLM